MLAYRRRSSSYTIKSVTATNDITLLTYCNWSYDLKYHIDEYTIVNMLRSFNNKYIPFYLRIFNETPKKVLINFVHTHNIDIKIIKNLHKLLQNREGLRVKEFRVA